MRPNGTVTCWGDNKFRLPEHLSSTYFIGIEAKQSIFCGVRSSDFSLLCWGNEIFENSNSAVLDNVVPGPCRSACPCRPLPLYGSFCSQGQMICEPCPILPTPPSPPQGTTGGGGGGWNKKMVAFLVVGCVGSASLLAVCCFLFYRYCNVRGCRVHDSGPLDMEANTRPQPPPAAAAAPVLEKKLSHLVSAGNGSHLEEFPLHLLLKATNNFWDDHKIGTGSFGSVYHAILDDGREVAIKRAETMAASSQGGTTKRQQDDKDSALQQLTPKSDVYSFGVVLLEILSGYKAIHQNEYGVPRNVVDFLAPYIIQEEIHRVLDPKVPPPTPFEIEAVAYVGYIAVDCVMPEGRHRPTISEIVNSLERALAACSPPLPQLSRSTTGSITEIGNSLEIAQAAGSPPSPSGPPPSPQLCRSTTGSST
ncbi:hypothetical protein C3L33_21732, partial [Rhododendron williamsianum]